MNILESKELLNQMHPGKKIDFEFDDSCIRHIEFTFSNGKPNNMAHVEYQKIKATIENATPIYMPISPHRICVALSEAYSKI